MQDICNIHLITGGAFRHNHAYPTCRTWSADGTCIFVESDDPGQGRSEGGSIKSIEIETGNTTILARTSNNCYGFDYSPGANTIVHIDSDGHSLCLMNLDTGRSAVIYEELEGTICAPPAISQNGTRVAYWCMFPSIANRFFDDHITTIMALDVDPAGCELVNPAWVVEAYLRRKTPQWKTDPKHGIHVNHPQINPVNKDHICYSHEMHGATQDGTPAMCRLWQVMADGDQNCYLVRQPAGLHFTHEVIAPDGRSLIFPYMHGVGQVDFGTFEKRSLYYNPDCCPGHLTVSPDLRWIAGDTWGEHYGTDGSRIQSIMMFDIQTRRCAHLCWIPMSKGHPGHPHPSFSPDGSKIAFTRLVDDVPQVAYIDVKEVMQNWGSVAQGVGEVASPHWR